MDCRVKPGNDERTETGNDMPDHLFVYGTLRAESAHPMAHRLQGCGEAYRPRLRPPAVSSISDLGPAPSSRPKRNTA